MAAQRSQIGLKSAAGTLIGLKSAAGTLRSAAGENFAILDQKSAFFFKKFGEIYRGGYPKISRILGYPPYRFLIPKGTPYRFLPWIFSDFEISIFRPFRASRRLRRLI